MLGGGPRVSSGVEEYKESTFSDGSTLSAPWTARCGSGLQRGGRTH